MHLTLDPTSTAVVLIDYQQGTLAMPMAPYDRAHITAAGGLLTVVTVAFAADGADLPPRNVDQPMALPAGGLPPTWTELAPEIAALPADIRIVKRQWSAFFGTELDLQLRRRGVRTIIVAGIATNFGVESTARDGWQLGYDVIVAADACASIGEDLHRMAMERTLPRVARIRDVETIIAGFGRQTV